jgi:flagellar biosynthesis regulator FlaF
MRCEEEVLVDATKRVLFMVINPCACNNAVPATKLRAVIISFFIFVVGFFVILDGF